MYEKLLEKAKVSNVWYWFIFVSKTICYLGIIIGLVYLYKYLHISGGNFIYNEF